jgi:hypothetical protein
MAHDYESYFAEAPFFPTASALNPYQMPAPRYRLVRMDFENNDNPDVFLECLVTGEQVKANLRTISGSDEIIATLDGYSGYQLGFMKGLNYHKFSALQ